MLLTRTLIALAAALTIALSASEAMASPPACMEDQPCWTWSTMGNYKRGVVTVWGTPKVVGPCAYRRIYYHTPRAMRPLLGPRLRGDWTALRHGCGR